MAEKWRPLEDLTVAFKTPDGRMVGSVTVDTKISRSSTPVLSCMGEKAQEGQIATKYWIAKDYRGVILLYMTDPKLSDGLGNMGECLVASYDPFTMTLKSGEIDSKELQALWTKKEKG